MAGGQQCVLLELGASPPQTKGRLLGDTTQGDSRVHVEPTGSQTLELFSVLTGQPLSKNVTQVGKNILHPLEQGLSVLALWIFWIRYLLALGDSPVNCRVFSLTH